ncbi:phage tail tape measure protein [Pseudarthrobacter sp. MEB009]|uniref:phage tail tape measure protein n=1 Tax=Pseudarthrobacter sp. MEB009 TaxID=3040326 RepID=UPI0025554F0C|nr:phage tail tape measure protein [Pseudarthrobacter sp. MEB009]
MSTRSARVVLELMIDKFISNAAKGSKAIKDVGDESAKAGKKADESAQRSSESTKQYSDELKKLAKSHHDAATAAGLQYNRAGQLIDSNGKVLTSSQAATKGLDAFSGAVYELGEDAERTAEKQRIAAEKAEAAAGKQAAAVEKSGTAMVAFGTATVAALGASAKAAMDWESAWAGVTKTVDGSPEQMAEIEQGLRNLAKTLPSTHTEIAAVAEAAGQLGVKREDILKFTKTMIDLGETTNLTAEEAATDIAQIANVMGTTGEEIDNFGAALVALGNDGASTEKDILSMAQRIAGAGKLVGASEADVLALSNTLASMGVKAELGGGVATRALLKMYAAVQGGGEKLDAFASAAGTSAEDFAAAFRTSPVAALEMVTKGMARTKDEGGNVVQVLKDMGMKGTEEMQVMLALAGAGDLLSESLALGSKAWEENTALVAEAAKRYETTESKATVAWNNIKDAAIDAGAVLLPIIASAAESVVSLSQAFGDLPAPVQGLVTGLGAVVGVTALVGGGLMLLLPKVRDGVQAFKDLDSRADGSSRGLNKAAKAATIASAAFVGFEVVKGLHNSMQEASASTEEFTQSLVGLSKEKDGLDNRFRDIGVAEFEGQIGSAGQALNKLINQDFNSAVESWGATALGVNNGMAKLGDAFEKTDQAVAAAATNGNMDLAAKGFKSVADSAAEQGIKVEEVAKRFPRYLDSLRAMASQSKVSLSEQDLLNWALGKTPPAMEAAAAGGDKAAEALVKQGAAAQSSAALTEEVVEQLEKVGLAADGSVSDIEAFTDALFNAGLLSLSASDSAIRYQDAIDSMTESVTKNGTTLDLNTEQGRANQSSYNSLAKAAMDAATATATETLATEGSAAAQAQLQSSLRTSYDDLVTAAGQLGITGDAADTMARKALGIPKEVPIDTWVNDNASEKLAGIIGQTDNLNGKQVDVFVNTHQTYFQKVIGLAPEADGTYGKGLGVLAPGRASGGDLDIAPGPKGVDSQLFMGAKGEHVFTDREVDLMGGQEAVYRFRAQVRAGQFQKLAGGGTVGSQAASAQIMALTMAGQPAGSGGVTLDFSGATYTSLDVAQLRRNVVDDVKYLLKEQGVRLGG